LFTLLAVFILSTVIVGTIPIGVHAQSFNVLWFYNVEISFSTSPSKTALKIYSPLTWEMFAENSSNIRVDSKMYITRECLSLFGLDALKVEYPYRESYSYIMWSVHSSWRLSLTVNGSSAPS